MLVTNQTTEDYWFGPLHLLGGIGQTLTVDDTSDTSLYLRDDGVADTLNHLYLSSKITVSGEAQPFPRPTGIPEILHGDGSPEGAIYAPQGSLYMRRNGTGTNSLYVKTTGVTIDTGWLSFGSAVGGAGTEWDYAQITAPVTGITATTEATAVACITGNSVTYDGTKVKVTVFVPGVLRTDAAPDGGLVVVVLRDTTVLGHSGILTNGSAPLWNGATIELFDTPPAGTHTYKVAAYSGYGTNTFQAGPGGSGNWLPAFIRVTKA